MDPDSTEATRTGMLSIVIPVGRVDRWLDTAVASVLGDDTLELEVIAVFNNGARVPAEWSFATDPRVRVLYTEDSLGPAGAGQWGIDVASGEFLVCLDADDIAYPGRLRKQREWMEQHPETVLVSSLVDWIDAEGDRVGSFSLPHGADIRSELVKLNVAPHSAWMARLDAVRAVGGYKIHMKQMEGYDLLLRIGLIGPIATIGEVLTGYRLHAEQMSRAVRPNGEYVAEIARGRRDLARAMGVGRVRTLAARVWWEAQQWMMFVGRKIRR